MGIKVKKIIFIFFISGLMLSFLLISRNISLAEDAQPVASGDTQKPAAAAPQEKAILTPTVLVTPPSVVATNTQHLSRLLLYSLLCLTKKW